MLLPSPDLTSTTLDAFARRYGTRPALVARAPGRVNVVGEHTDYLGGRCLPLALPYATWVAMSPRFDGEVHLSSGPATEWSGTAEDLLPARPLDAGWQAYVLGALRGARWRTGVDLHVESSVPSGAGLSSSAALICSVALAASDASPPTLLDACVEAEQVHVGAPTGGMDQAVALLAQPGHALALDFADGAAPRARQVRWQPGEAGLELLVIDTGARHDNADGAFARRRSEAETAMALSSRALEQAPDPLPRRRRHVETENRRVDEVVAAASSGDWARVGTLLTQSHLSLRDDHEVSSRELDRVVDAALAAGAWGARMTGGGFGGCAVALSPVALREEVCAAVTRSAVDAGAPRPRFLAGDASGPALRLRSVGPLI